MQHRLPHGLLLTICVSLLTTGCGQRMLKNYSSLRPKYSHIDRSDDLIHLASMDSPAAPNNQSLMKPIIRSQNEILISPTGLNPRAGHSVRPTARLLTPDFGQPATSQPPSRPETTPDSAAPSLTGHSIGESPSVLRVMERRVPENNITPQSSRPDTPGIFTPPPPAPIQITPRNALQYDAGFPQTPASLSPEVPSAPAVSTLPITPPSASTQPAISLPPTSADTLNLAEPPAPDVPSEERSMLDRLRGLYDGQEEKQQKSLWRRNLERLSNPLGVFRERTPEPPATPEVTEPPASETPGTVLPPAPLDREQTLNSLILAIESELQTWPRGPSGQPTSPRDYARRQQDLRMLYLIADQPGHAVESIPGASGVEQEFWQELMLSLAHFRAHDELPHEERMTVTAGQLKSATRHLAKESVLSIRRLELCSQINSFGRISVFPSNDFEAGQPLLLYAEIDNFGTELTSRGTQRTSFDAQLQILHGDSDTPIETTELDDISDEASSQRTDYFQSFELTVPSHLAAGDYRIQLQVRDKLRNRLATEIIPFQVR